MEKRLRMQRRKQDLPAEWTVEQANELYGFERWSHGVFGVNAAGHAVLHGLDGSPEIDLKELVDEIRLRGLPLPVLIRFTDILRRRMAQINEAFRRAMDEHDYKGDYRGVFPIKVNQHRHVLEDIVAFGREHHYGLEVGSKPELLIAAAHHDDPEALIICNGFKDREYVDLALEVRRLGHRIFLVIEKPWELPLIIERARALGVDPLLGIRMKLAARGKGMWESSGGDRSKFGLFTEEILAALRTLRSRKMLDRLQLLHFHIGSQIPDIQRIKDALREMTAIFAEVRRTGAPIQYLDVGGGLAVDYDGSRTNFASSANYGAREYAADVVNAIALACNEAGVEHPTIVTEAGRSLVAHHSMLVVEAFATSRLGEESVAPKVPRNAPPVLLRMREIHDGLMSKNFQECYHDALEARREALMLFNLRHLSLEDRARVEAFFWVICRKLHRLLQQLDYIPDEFEGLASLLSTTYYCNFSIFQSIPDHWAIGQLFPVAPLHRLGERPEVEGILADITCDSDGVVDKFVDLRDVKDTVRLHPLKKGEPYHLGIFLVGAYQEILGDLHNLFGDPTIVHVSSGPNGYLIDKTLRGDTVMDVLNYVQFLKPEIQARIRHKVEAALKAGLLTLEQSAAFMRRYERDLDAATYLESRT